jgi:hypothetical protein
VAETVDSDIVINEILASNLANASDEEGEFDDWIELYNNSNEALSLYGYYLSDNSQDLKKWALPYISIAAFSYLIIWADDDEEQGENHTSFKISADGEELFLTTSDGRIADQVIFGGQQTDLSLGRYPNGTGVFQTLEPTFNSENRLDVTSIGPEPSVSTGKVIVYPNPFISSTTIEFSLEEASSVSLAIYNSLGQEIMVLINEYLPVGKHTVQWTGSGESGGDELESGLYLFRLDVNNNKGVSTYAKQILKLK